MPSIDQSPERMMKKKPEESLKHTEMNFIVVLKRNSNPIQNNTKNTFSHEKKKTINLHNKAVIILLLLFICGLQFLFFSG